MPTDHWMPYVPDATAPWNLRRVVHLHRRAGFAATWSELQRDLNGDPQEAVARLLTGQARVDGQPSDYESTARLLSEAAVVSGQDLRLKAAWVYRMLFSPDPLGERLTLMWHNHFATSNRKVHDLKRMQRQNDLFRQHARGKFGELLASVVRDPAMLAWLDADTNRAGHPNENLAREMLELFTLGVGQYTESDVQQTARALTGWRVVAEQFRFDEHGHDGGQKTVLGQTGSFTGDDILKIVSGHPATAQNVARRICRTFMGEGQADGGAIDQLAAGLRQREIDVNWAVETVLRSARFFAEANLNTRIIGPPEYVVGAVRSLECFSPPPSTLLLAEWMARMGQELFYPPNVGGWSEGKSWLSSTAIVARANFAAALVNGRLAGGRAAPDFEALVQRHCGQSSLDVRVEWLGELLLGGLPPEVTQSISARAAAGDKAVGSPLGAAALLLLSRPESHLG
jgi:uncharacterized protein (DUF1800 family)